MCAWVKEDQLDELEARMLILKELLAIYDEFIEIQGPEGSPYEKGIFKLNVSIPERY